MTNLEQLIEEKKNEFVVDKEELNKRIENRLVHYNMIMPPPNTNEALYLKVRRYYQTLQQCLIDSSQRLNSGYTLDSTNSKVSKTGITVVYNKSEEHQKKDAALIRKEERALYQSELDKDKEQFILDLTQQQAAEATEIAKAQSAQSILDLQAELSKLLTSK
jgi:hypothetical protein